MYINWPQVLSKLSQHHQPEIFPPSWRTLSPTLMVISRGAERDTSSLSLQLLSLVLHWFPGGAGICGEWTGEQRCSPASRRMMKLSAASPLPGGLPAPAVAAAQNPDWTTGSASNIYSTRAQLQHAFLKTSGFWPGRPFSNWKTEAKFWTLWK